MFLLVAAAADAGVASSAGGFARDGPAIDYVESAVLKNGTLSSAAAPASGAAAAAGCADQGGSCNEEEEDLEEYEEHKQPQTEEIMNAEMLAEASAAAAAAAAAGSNNGGGSVPRIVKTTTKQVLVRNADGVRHNKEEKIEDLTPGGSGAVTVVSSTNQVSYTCSGDLA